MKKHLLSVLLAFTLMPAFAQDYTITVGNVVTEVTFYSPEIVRVMKYQATDALGKTDPKVVVTMTPQAVNPVKREGDREDTLLTDKVMVTCNKQTGLLGFFRPDGTVLIKERAKAAFTRRTSHTIDPYNVAQSFRLSTDEAIYGFGQVQDGNLNHRNKSYSHMVQNNMSVWIPFFHSTRGYGLYWDLYGPCDFSDNAASGATFKTEAAHAVDYYVLVGRENEGDDVVRRIRELTGKATMVPLWTYGYFQSKERYQSALETLGVLQKYRSLRVPIDCVVQDWQYWGGNNQWNAMEFLSPQFRNDYPTMINGMHADGAHLLISVWANFGPDTKQFKHFKEHNQLMKMGDDIMSATWPNNAGVGIYSPYQQSARDYYWQCLYEGLVNKGVDAYWVDSSEPDHYQGGEDWEKTSDFIVLNKDDEDNATLNPHSLQTYHTWRSVRNVFPLMHASGVYNGHRAQQAELTEAKRVMIMTRSGFLGLQRYGAGTWSGDITSSWETLANQIPAALNYSACGVASWNSDIGGFFNGSYQGAGQDTYNELYCRWIQFGAFCTIMRSHGSGADRAIYQFGQEGESYYDVINRYIHLRYALLPYIYSTARRVHADDYSFMRAMGIAYPADAATHALKDQFLFGRDILVAPVLQPQALQRSVYLPKGDKWTDIWSGQQYDGGQTVDRAVNLALMPLFVRQGSILPWGPDVQYSEQHNWDNLELRIYPGADGQFTLYEDERDNYNYEQGSFSEIPFTWDDATHTLTIGQRSGAFQGMLPTRTFRIVLVDADRRMGLGIKQSVRFSKDVVYTGSELSVKIDNDHLVAEPQAAVQRIEVTPATVQLFLGQTRPFAVQATLTDGTKQYVTLDAVCESSDSLVAYVRDGLIHANNKEGQATIDVTYTDGFGTDHHTSLTVEAAIPTNLYTWKAVDWYRNRVADRLAASDIRYSSQENTITITKKGAQNIALRYMEKKYREPGMKYFVAVATDVSKSKNDSQLWYINGTWVNIVNPVDVRTLQDGRIMVSWSIEENEGYALTGETVFGLTSTHAQGKSVVSYVGFTANLNAFEQEMQQAAHVVASQTLHEGAQAIYALDGTPRSQLAHGVNIVTRDGKAVKLCMPYPSPAVNDVGPVPTDDQLRWHDMEMYAFIHYSLNTYTDQEWGFGNEDPKLFNPSNLDCRQWARVCKQAGMRGIIFTAKHHCGFCMWPSKYTEYSVKNAPWKQGKGDVVRELAEACREEGLRFAVYLSPWDRNHKDYGRPEYITYFRNQLRELLTQYGDIFEVWFDGANGGDGWYGGANETRKIDRTTYYQWPETYRMIRQWQPHCLIWNDGGDRGDLRWVGTEAGNVGETNWCLMPAKGDTPWHMLHYGVEDGDVWCPGETNTSIRPGWFYHDTENEHVKSLSKLMDTYYKSVGRGSTLLLNFPIAPNGRIHPVDSLRGIAFKRMIDQVFSDNLIDKATVTSSPLTTTISFQSPTAFNRFLAEEDIVQGQRVKAFTLEALVDGRWQPLRDALVEQGDGLTTIGHRRIICFPTVTATQLRFTITDAKAQPIIKRLGVYLAPELTADIPHSGEKKSSALHIFFSSPRQMLIDWDTDQTFTTFRYLPPQDGSDGTITHYTLWASSDWSHWQKLASGEFSNIVNNPIWQTVTFPATKARILKFDADRLATGERMGYADIEIR